MALKVLIIEDQIEQLDYLELATRQFWNKYKDSLKLNKLHIDRAAVAVDARLLLAQAAEQSEPYDLILLDLGLPENANEKEQTDLGLQLIEIARKNNAANHILVISAFQDFDYVVPAFQCGANDFIKKPFDKGELFHRINLLLTMLLDEARKKTLDNRQRELAPYVWKYVAHRFSACFGDFIQAVGNETDLLSDEISERFGLSRIGTSQDPIVKSLRGITQASQAAHEEWIRLHEAFDVQPDDLPAKLSLEKWLAKIALELRQCLNLNSGSDRKSETCVLSIGGNWQTAMREILLGGLSDPQQQQWGAQVNVSIHAGGDLAEIMFEDDLPAISQEIADKINRRENILPTEGPWRAWGLGIVQHLASLGGGKLLVRPSAREKGNRISLFIPQVRHG